MTGDSSKSGYDTSPLFEGSSIQACLENVEVYKEGWGSYVRIDGWTFARNTELSKIEAWIYPLPTKLFSIRKWFHSISRRKNPTILKHGVARPDLIKTYGSLFPENAGFYGLIPLDDKADNAEMLSLCIRITMINGKFREVCQVFSSANFAPRKATLSEISAMTDNPVRLAAPNFFILGAAKCGTTSLYHALSQHPEIYLSAIKEPTFFNHRPLIVKTPVEYFNLYPFASGKKFYGEASHGNFSAPEAAPILRQLFPDAKFLLILRNPVKRAYALYQHLYRNGKEPLKTFEEALSEEDKRFLDGRFRDHSCAQFWNYMYVRSSLYHFQLERYFALFSREQFFVLTLGEWKSNPGLWAEKIFRFLGINSEIPVTTEPMNQAPKYEPMSESTHQFLLEKFATVRDDVESLIGRRLEYWEY